jgi:sporulation protein YlmC with PRC-barrel domain
MLVPFGTHVRDRDGKSVGTVSRLVLHPDSREVVALVVQQGLVDRREVVVPLKTVKSVEGDEVRLDLRAAELEGLDVFNAPALKPMPDHWPMPMGFDQRSFFLVPDAWSAAVLPFQLTSSTVSGTPAYIADPDAAEGAREPAIATGTAVYDSTGQRIGEVEGVELDPATARITRILIRRGRILGEETAIPASLIAAVADDRITLGAAADEVKKLERVVTGKLGTAPAA